MDFHENIYMTDYSPITKDLEKGDVFKRIKITDSLSLKSQISKFVQLDDESNANIDFLQKEIVQLRENASTIIAFKYRIQALVTLIGLGLLATLLIEINDYTIATAITGGVLVLCVGGCGYRQLFYYLNEYYDEMEKKVMSLTLPDGYLLRPESYMQYLIVFGTGSESSTITRFGFTKNANMKLFREVEFFVFIQKKQSA